MTATYEDGEGEGKTVVATSMPIRSGRSPAGTALLRSLRTLIPDPDEDDGSAGSDGRGG